VEEFLCDTPEKKLRAKEARIALKQKFKYPVDYRNSGTDIHVGKRS